jgi:hypothetical protein
MFDPTATPEVQFLGLILTRLRVQSLFMAIAHEPKDMAGVHYYQCHQYDPLFLLYGGGGRGRCLII